MMKGQPIEAGGKSQYLFPQGKMVDSIQRDASISTDATCLDQALTSGSFN